MEAIPLTLAKDYCLLGSVHSSSLRGVGDSPSRVADGRRERVASSFARKRNVKTKASSPAGPIDESGPGTQRSSPQPDDFRDLSRDRGGRERFSLSKEGFSDERGVLRCVAGSCGEQLFQAIKFCPFCGVPQAGGASAELPVNAATRSAQSTGNDVTVSDSSAKPSLTSAISLDCTSLQFHATVGSESAFQSITVTNEGNAVLTVRGVKLEGSDAGEFQLGSCCSSVRPGSSGTISVMFHPSSKGSKSASIRIKHDADDGREYFAGYSISTVTLRGNAKLPKQVAPAPIEPRAEDATRGFENSVQQEEGKNSTDEQPRNQFGYKWIGIFFVVLTTIVILTTIKPDTTTVEPPPVVQPTELVETEPTQGIMIPEVPDPVIAEKLQEAQECASQGDFVCARSAANEVLSLDPSNDSAVEVNSRVSNYLENVFAAFNSALQANNIETAQSIFRDFQRVASIGGDPRIGDMERALDAQEQQRINQLRDQIIKDDNQSAAAVPAVVSQGSPARIGRMPSSEDYYPAASKRAEEQGAVTVRVCVDPRGNIIGDPAIITSSGFERLDKGAVKLARAGRYQPGVEAGRPQGESCVTFRVKFELNN